MKIFGTHTIVFFLVLGLSPACIESSQRPVNAAKSTPVHSNQTADNTAYTGKMRENLAKTITNSSTFQCDYLGQEPPGDKPVVFAPGVVSTEKMEYRCVISPNGEEIFFTREGTIYRITRKNQGSGWNDPAPAPFSGKYIDGESCLSMDGNRIYWCSRRPLPGAVVPLNLWISQKTDGQWGEPFPLRHPANNQTIHAPTVSANGNLYASGIIRLKYNEGKYLPPEKLQPEIKGHHPFIAPDESYLIFGNKRPQGYIFWLYIVFRKPNGTWTEPLSLGEQINSSRKQGNASVTPDGKYIFFSRDEDIYWVKATVIGTLKAKALGPSS